MLFVRIARSYRQMLMKRGGGVCPEIDKLLGQTLVLRCPRALLSAMISVHRPPTMWPSPKFDSAEQAGTS